MSEIRRIFSKYTQHRNAKYVAEICGNSPRSHITDIIRSGLTTATEIGKTHLLTVLYCALLVCFYLV